MKRVVFAVLMLSLNTAFTQNKDSDTDLNQTLIEEEIFSSDNNLGESDDEDSIFPVPQDSQDVENLYGLNDETDNNEPFGFFVEQGGDENLQENKTSNPEEVDESEEETE